MQEKGIFEFTFLLYNIKYNLKSIINPLFFIDIYI